MRRSATRLTPIRHANTLAAALLAVACCAAAAAPFVPASDEQVIEQLPTRIGPASERRDERALRAQLRRDPSQLPLALQLARAAIDRARQDGDPRELGQAQAALAPWWAQPAPPPPVRLLRAIVLQSRHEFEPSTRDLDALLADLGLPIELRAQAELTRASVLQVQGRFADALSACDRLAGPTYTSLGMAVRLPAMVCQADLASLQGRDADAQRRIALIERLTAGSAAPGASDGNAAWLALVRAEMAERRGDEAAATFYQQALKGHTDIYTLAAYADWLLAHDRPAEVVRLLASRESVDPLLLRLGIAYRRSNDPRAPATIAMLAARFEAARVRGDTSHGREASRFALELQDDPAQALQLALANWAVQKEIADALGLVRAAQAARQPDAAAPVWRFVRDTGWTDARLQALSTPTGTRS